MKKGVRQFLILALFVSIIYLGFASAAVTCNVVAKSDCSSSNGGHIVMGLYSMSNSHASDAAYSNGTLGTMPYVLCCYNFGSGDTSCLPLGNPSHYVYGSSVPDNKIVGLYQATNSHSEVTGGTTYTNNICYNGLECMSTTSGCYQTGYTINVFNLSTSTNSHISATSTSGFNIAICCELTGLGSPTTSTCSLSSSSITPSTANSGDTITMAVSGTNCAGASIDYTVKDSQGNTVYSTTGTYPNQTWVAQPAGSYTFTATAVASGSSTSTSNTLSVKSMSIGNCPSTYPNVQCSDYTNAAECNANNVICHANTSDSNYLALTTHSNSAYDPSFYKSWCAWNTTLNNCQFEYQDGPSQNIPVLCDGTSCANFVGCGNGTTLCYSSSSGGYYCYPGNNCPTGDTPTSGGSCGFLSGGCSNSLCEQGSQDSCASGTSCALQSGSAGGGGLCSGTVSSGTYCYNGDCYNQSVSTGGCANGFTLCSASGINFCYPGTSCPAGTTAPNPSGSCGVNDSCASPGCLTSTQTNPKGSCIGDAYCKSGACYSPTAFSGTCELTTSTSGNCSAGGFLQLNVKAVWTGDQSKIPPSCKDGTRPVECPPQIPLPFFNAYNAIATIAVLILIYVAVVLARKNMKKKRPAKKSRKSPRAKTAKRRKRKQ